MIAARLSFKVLFPICLVLVLAGCSTSSSDNSPGTEGSAIKETVRRIPKGPSAALAFSPNGKTLAGAGSRSVHLFDTASGQEAAQVDVALNDGEYCQHLAFSPDGKRIVSVHMGLHPDHPVYCVHLWDVTGDNRLQKSRTLLVQRYSEFDTLTFVFQASFSLDSKYVVSGSRTGMVHVWEAATGRERLQFRGGAFAAFSEDGRTLIAVSHDGLVRHWDAATGKAVQAEQRKPRKDFISAAAVALAPGNKALAIHDGNMVSLRNVATGEELQRLDFDQPVQSLAMSPQGQFLAVAVDNGGGIWFLDGETCRLRSWWPGGGTVAFSADGKYVAWGETEGLVIREVSEVIGKGGKPPAPVYTEPPGLLLEGELIAIQDTYSLALGGRTAEEFSQDITNRVVPPVPAFLQFRLRNTGDQKITFQPSPRDVDLVITGEGAINADVLIKQTGVIIPPDTVTLSPGESRSFFLETLRSDRYYSYWLLPGEYTIRASFSNCISPAPKGVQVRDDGSGWVTVRSRPIKVQVVEPPK